MNYLFKVVQDLVQVFDDEAYKNVGATILNSKEEIYATCDFVTKVKEIEECEYTLLRENQIIFTCIHPAASKEKLMHYLKQKLLHLRLKILIDMVLPTVKLQGNLEF